MIGYHSLLCTSLFALTSFAVLGYGWPSDTGMDSEETQKFSALTGVNPLIETYPLEEANEAYHRMMVNKAQLPRGFAGFGVKTGRTIVVADL